jgi:hypothetical protein
MPSLILKVHGPIKVPFYTGKGGRTITDENIEEFWETNPKFAHRKGCYVFGIRAGKGNTPGYVGKATKSFKQEVFTGHKLSRYHQFLVDYAKGTPVFFSLAAPVKKGKPNDKKISAIERYLISLGITANEDLLNERDTKTLDWGIKGVVRGGKGKSTKGTQSFRLMMGIK